MSRHENYIALAEEALNQANEPLGPNLNQTMIHNIRWMKAIHLDSALVYATLALATKDEDG